MSSGLNVSMRLTATEHVDPVMCHTYSDRPPILSLTNMPGEAVTLTVDPDLPVDQQMYLAVQMVAAVRQFRDALATHHLQSQGQGDDA